MKKGRKMAKKSSSDDTPDRARLLELGTEAATETDGSGRVRPPGKIRGRPAKERKLELVDSAAPVEIEPVAAPLIMPRSFLRDAIKAPYAVIAARLGKHWELSDAEADLMVESHNELVTRFMPEWADKKNPLYAVLYHHGLVIAGRLELMNKLMGHFKEQADAAPKATAADHGIPQAGSVTMAPAPSRFGNIVELPPGTQPTPNSVK